jgi:plasmid rolling circle replication initiator protein Rep
MRAYGFRRVSETEPTEKGGLYKRGHYDLVILNPDFVKNHPLNIVCGKNYKELLSILSKLSITPLIWACEIVYFPKTKQLPKNAIKTIEQDTLKVKETRSLNFCKIGSIHAFTGHPHSITTHLEKQIKGLAEREQAEVTFTTA